MYDELIRQFRDKAERHRIEGKVGIARDYVHAADAIDELWREVQKYRKHHPVIPPADVVEVRHGRWIFKSDDQPISNDKVYGCSLCDDKNRRYYEWQLSNYCPNCGAKMDGGQEND